MKYDNKILRDIYESVEGLYAFTFYSKYKIQPSQLFNFIKKFTRKGYIQYDENRLSITDEGRRALIKEKILTSKNGDKFSSIPEDFRIEKLKVDEPYIPNINEVPDEIMKD